MAQSILPVNNGKVFGAYGTYEDMYMYVQKIYIPPPLNDTHP